MSDLKTLKLRTPRIVIDDVSCDRCGYNLRGLNDPGACPECGRAVFISMLSHVERGKVAPPIDPAWAKKIIEGSALGIIAYLVMAIRSVLLPVLSGLPGMGKVAFGMSCCWWVTGMLGADRLFRPHLRDAHLLRPNQRYGRARSFLIAYALSPLFWLAPGLPFEGAEGPIFLPYIISLYLTVKILQRAGDLVRRAEGPAAYAYLVPWLMVLKLIGSLILSIVRPDQIVGLGRLLEDLPVVPFNPCVSLQDLIRRSVNTQWAFDWVVAAIAFLDLVTVIMWSHIFVMYRRKLRAIMSPDEVDSASLGSELRLRPRAKPADVGAVPEDDHGGHQHGEGQ